MEKKISSTWRTPESRFETLQSAMRERLPRSERTIQGLIDQLVEAWLIDPNAPKPEVRSDSEIDAIRADPVFGPMLKSLVQAWKASKR